MKLMTSRVAMSGLCRRHIGLPHCLEAIIISSSVKFNSLPHPQSCCSGSGRNTSSLDPGCRDVFIFLPLSYLKCKSNHASALLYTFKESAQNPHSQTLRSLKQRHVLLYNFISTLFLPPHILAFPNCTSFS